MTGLPPESPSATSLDPLNPFSSRAVRPGALDYLFPPNDSLARLLDRLRDHHWWGEIVGPHGSGKSTLLESLRPALLDAGRTVQQFTLNSGQRRLSAPPREISGWDDQTQLVVDGFEQLSWWQRRLLQRTCRRRGCGLLITAHRSFGLPAIVNTTATLELTEQIVATLHPGGAADQISAAEIQDAFSRHQGNVREVLFELYDLFQRRAGRCQGL